MYSSCFNPANEVRIAFIPYTEIASETCIRMTRKVLGGWEGKGREGEGWGLGVTIYYNISIIRRRMHTLCRRSLLTLAVISLHSSLINGKAYRTVSRPAEMDQAGRINK